MRERNIKKRSFITTLLATVQTNAKINVLSGTGATLGTSPEKPDFTKPLKEQLEYWALQAISLNCALQVEYEFSNQLVLGLNIHATGLPYPWPYIIAAIGPFFGGQICNVSTTKLHTTALYIKGGINYAGTIMPSEEQVKSYDLTHGINPYIELSFRRHAKESPTKEGQTKANNASFMIHAIEIGFILQPAEDLDNYMTTRGYPITPQIKYKAMWQLV